MEKLTILEEATNLAEEEATLKRIRIHSDDRIGITHDVLSLVAGHEINLKSMEVAPNQIHLKLDDISPAEETRLLKGLHQIPGIITAESVDFLPYERREKQIQAVLNAVSEGIIAVDERGSITHFNPAAAEIVQAAPADAIGRAISKVLNNEDLPILDTIQTGEGYDNREIKLTTSTGKSHYFTSGRPIINEAGKIMGAVATLKDIQAVRKLYHTIHHSSMITFEEIVYASKAMEEVIALARRAAMTNSTVLLRGESGTGKELFARAIHSASFREDQPFVAINCAALPDTLLESELFGYEEGTFTGAKKGGKQGLFELADRGTIFLDEIGEIPPHLQVKLLRVLQERRVRRVGGSDEIKVDVRVIAATNKNLEAMIQTQEFREDLYYRLNVIPVQIPSLRQRKEDLPYLIEHFLAELTKEMHLAPKPLSEQAKAKLLAHSWPGNVRELRNVLERAINLARGKEIRSEDLLLQSDNIPCPEQEEHFAISGEKVQIRELAPLEELVAELERSVLERAYAEYKSTREVGKALGVSHTTIINKCKKYGIELER